MELLMVWRFLLRRWWIILLPIVIVALLVAPQLITNEQVASGGFVTVFRYSAAQQDSNYDVRDGDYQDVWLASEFVVNAFTDWIKTSSFRAELANILNDDSINTGAIGIATDNDRSIGIVELRYSDGEALANIANAAIVVLQQRNNAYFPHLGESPAQVTIIDTPVVLAVPPDLGNRLDPIIRIALAFMGGFALAIFIEYLDQRIFYADELEAQGIKIIATVPKHDEA